MSLDNIRASRNGDLLVSPLGDRRSRRSWTGRLWFRNHGTYSVSIIARDGWQVNQFGANQIQFVYQSNAVLASGLAIDTWHHVVFGYDAGSESQFVQLNNGARTVRKLFFPSLLFDVVADPLGAFAITGNYQPTGTGDQILDIDEIGFWNDVVWTEEETETDWNEGDGVGYEDSMKRAAAYWSLDEFDSAGPNTLKDEVGGYILTDNGSTISSIDTGKIGDCLQLANSGIIPAQFDGVAGDWILGGE